MPAEDMALMVMDRLARWISAEDAMRASTDARGSLSAWIVLVSLLLAATLPARAVVLTPIGLQAVPAASVELSLIAHPLEHPWSISFLPDGDILVTERPGRLRRVVAP